MSDPHCSDTSKYWKALCLDRVWKKITWPQRKLSISKQYEEKIDSLRKDLQVDTRIALYDNERSNWGSLCFQEKRREKDKKPKSKKGALKAD